MGVPSTVSIAVLSYKGEAAFSGVAAQWNDFPVSRGISLLAAFAIRLAEYPPDDQAAESKCETYHHGESEKQLKGVHGAKNTNGPHLLSVTDELRACDDCHRLSFPRSLARRIPDRARISAIPSGVPAYVLANRPSVLRTFV